MPVIGWKNIKPKGIERRMRGEGRRQKTQIKVEYIF
jgi:hypothetical protein